MKKANQLIKLDAVDAVIFDMDGVVTRSAGGHAEAWKRTFDEYLKEHARRTDEPFQPFDIENDYRTYVDGKPRYEGAESFLKSRNITIPYGSPEDPPDKETVCGLGNRKNAYFLEHIKERGVQPYESTVEFIEYLKTAGKRVAVISSSKNALDVLEAAGVRELFNVAVEGKASEKLGLKGKPHPDIFLEAARQLNVPPERAAVVEDAIAGVEAGKAGGFVLVVGINRGEQEERMRELGADVVVSDLTELEPQEKVSERKASELPSAIKEKDRIVKRLCEGMPAIFLDYDGTLMPIAEEPDLKLLNRVRTALKKLAERWTVVVMSEEAPADARKRIGVENLVYAGTQGLTIEDPSEPFSLSLGRHYQPLLDHAEMELNDAAVGLSGISIERMPYAITVGLSGAAEVSVREVERRIDEIVGQNAELTSVSDDGNIEIRPNLEWDKGKMLLHLVHNVHVDHSRLIPLYIGDDVSDEYAFRVVDGIGIGILVGPGEQKTAAEYSLKSPDETVRFIEELVKIVEKEVSRGIYTLVYEGFDADSEQLRESLCVTGNGYFATRGAAPESRAGEIHYPGTYLAGIYNRLTSEVAGHIIENESLVNVPNWLPLSFRIEDGDWFEAESANILEYRQELDMDRGVLTRTVRFKDAGGRHTRFTQRRFTHIGLPHVAALETTIVAEDWSGSVEVRSAVDGNIENTLVKRYRQLNNHHLLQVATGEEGPDILWLLAETNQSHIHIAEAIRTRVFLKDQPMEVKRRLIQGEGYIGHEFDMDVRQGEIYRIEKIAAVFDSKDRAISESSIAAREEVRYADDFSALLTSHLTGWSHLWESWHIHVESDSQRMAQILNLHIFHLLQTVSPNSVYIDAGIPPRGLHGEAYRGLIMWDELFIFPLFNMRIPEITGALLRYRYRRLPAARRAARGAGYQGAMFPWQSGSNGREEAQTLHLNPESGRWIPDNSQLERHINIAVAYNVWQYYEVSGDIEFMTYYGTELLVELARFWASNCHYNHSLNRYEICHVMGPDEFHDRFPGKEEPGIDNNSYTNVMVVWLMCKALASLNIIPIDRRNMIREDLQLRKEELAHWEDISRKMRIVFHDDGIISQFEGYGDLKEFDWEGYRKKYGDIHRLDRILEAEEDSPNNYKVSKQADVLMLFYLLSADELGELFKRLGYTFDSNMIPRNIEYYLKRTSHGSTLSRVVHSWVLARSRREVSWHLFQDALESDVSDIQGGTTHEGIHLGAMAGTVDIIQRAYSGLETRGDVLRFNPVLPKGLASVEFEIRYRGHWLNVRITRDALRVTSRQHLVGPIQIALDGTTHVLAPGNTLQLSLSSR